MKSFFHNRVAEIVDNIGEIRKYCPVEDIHYVASADNPADLGTRVCVKPEDLGPNSFWQKGPSFFGSWRGLWDVSRDFTRDPVPDEEVRQRGTAAFTAYMRAYAVQVKAGPDKKTYAAGSDSPLVWKAVTQVLFYSDSMVRSRVSWAG